MNELIKVEETINNSPISKSLIFNHLLGEGGAFSDNDVNWHRLDVLLSAFSVDFFNIYEYLEKSHLIERFKKNVISANYLDDSGIIFYINESGIKLIEPLLLRKKEFSNFLALINSHKFILNDNVSFNDDLGFVYAYHININGDDFYKIGKSKSSVDSRGKVISSGLPFKGLELLKCTKVANYSAAELHLHNKFKDYRTNGEWFKLDKVNSDLLTYHMNKLSLIESKITVAPQSMSSNFYLGDTVENLKTNYEYNHLTDKMCEESQWFFDGLMEVSDETQIFLTEKKINRNAHFKKDSSDESINKSVSEIINYNLMNKFMGCHLILDEW
jgi:hypothetical protein